MANEESYLLIIFMLGLYQGSINAEEKWSWWGERREKDAQNGAFSPEITVWLYIVSLVL